MADVNATCDRWIAEIRAGTKASENDFAQSPPVPTQPIRQPSPITFQMSYAVGTVLMAFLTMFMIVLIVGTATPTVAVGALFGSMAGAAYMTVVCVIARRE